MSSLISLFDTVPEIAGRLFAGRGFIAMEVCRLLNQKIPVFGPLHAIVTIVIDRPTEDCNMFLELKSAYLRRFKQLTCSVKIVGDDDHMKFLSLIPSFGQLHSLDIRGNHVGAEGMRLLIATIPDLGKLNSLLLGDNRLGVQGMRLLSTALSPPCKLNQISLEKNSLGGTDMEGMRILVMMLSNLTNTTRLSLGDNKLGVEGARLLATALPSLLLLDELDLSDNWLRAEGIRLISSGLPKLRVLNLANNRLGAEGIKWLASTELFHSLVDINVEFNQLGYEGAKFLCLGLTSAAETGGAPLARLNAMGNQLGPRGAEVLGGCLPLLRLRDLDLGDNQLAAEGARLVGDGIASLRELRRLNMADNRLGAEGVALVGRSVSGAGQLEWLGLEGNQVDDKGVQALAQALGAWCRGGGAEATARTRGGGLVVELSGNGLLLEQVACRPASLLRLPHEPVALGRTRAMSHGDAAGPGRRRRGHGDG